MKKNLILRVEKLSKSYKNYDCKILSLSNLNFEIERGEFVSIIGSSGCGKTTLLKIMAGLEKYEVGNLKWFDKNKKISFLFQEPCLFPWMTVLQNIELPLTIRREKNKMLAQDMMKFVGLEKFANNLPSELSGGMKQRVALARGLVENPDVIFMDEPFGALDEITRNKLGLELSKLSVDLGFTCIFVTHSISEAIFLSDRVIILSERPAKIKKEININLERPRLPEIMDTLEFLNYTKCLRKIITK